MGKKSKQKRILFFGQTGVGQKVVLEKLKHYMSEEIKINSDEIGIYKHEDYLPGDIRIHALADAELDDKTKREKWVDALKESEKIIEDEDCRYALYSTHCTLYRNNRFMSFIDYEAVKSFQPDKIVTLIDDIYSIWNRIMLREKPQKGRTFTESYFTLNEISNWRWVEIMKGDSVANFINLNNLVVSVKHPVEMLYRLLFEEQKYIIVYSSIPISAPRNRKEKRDEVDKFKQKLHNEFIVFDPLTIDEKILTFLLTEQYPEWLQDNSISLYGKELKIEINKECERWPISYPRFGSLNCDWPEDYPICIDAGEAVEVCRPKSPQERLRLQNSIKDLPTDETERRRRLFKVAGQIKDSVIDHHIRLRDFRLIDDSQCLIAYRPLYEKKPPGGQVYEISYAQDLKARKKFDIIIYHDKSKDGPIIGGPFPHLEKFVVDSEDDLDIRLNQLKDSYQ